MTVKTNDAAATRIFISSTAQVNLTQFRQKIRDDLNEAGHIGVIFEQDIGSYSSKPMQDCIDKVKECDVFFLYLSNKAGSFLVDEPYMTATYAEYSTALNEGLIIIPFVEQHLLDAYKSHLKDRIHHAINEYKHAYHRDPETYDMVQDILNNIFPGDSLANQLKLLDADPFIWSFIHDVYSNSWTNKFVLSDSASVNEFAKTSLSQILRISKKYYLEKDVIEEILLSHQNHVEYIDRAEAIVRCIEKGKLDTRQVLEILKSDLCGGVIYEKVRGVIMNAGTISDCHAVVLYKCGVDYLEPIEFVGNVTASRFLISDSSYVSDTYKSTDDSEFFFYDENKYKLYMLKKIDELVLSAQFNMSNNWTERRVKSFETEIASAIMSNNQSYDFGIKILGGMLNV
ncbi:DUF4062 domain-containing protein [Bacillus sp. JJ722]|uniref:DUF4062 domain-containing protein n=1 Tax=Bacillus sp. JJ722 TaxID=3122973 RepID=UPI002FFE06CB